MRNTGQGEICATGSWDAEFFRVQPAAEECVETTVRDAFVRDYHVILAEDCAGAPRKEEHESAAHNVRTYFGQVLTSEQITARWSAA